MRLTYRPRLEQLEPRIVLSFNPTGLEQELFQLVNRFRADPQGELTRLVSRIEPLASSDPYISQQLQYWGVSGAALASQWQGLTPVPPLAWNESLYAAAHEHNRQMLAHDSQEHQFPGEPDPGQRMRSAGYEWRRWGENIYAYPRSVLEAHGGFVLDWGAGPAGIQDPPNHRIRLLRKEFVHIGVAIDEVGCSNLRNTGPLLVTQDLATPLVTSEAYVVGAVYKQSGSVPWYVAGAGFGNAQVVFEGPAGTFEATSMAAGGYQIQLPPGTYRGRASGGRLPGLLMCDEFTVGADNVAIDFVYPVDRRYQPEAVDDAFVADLGTARVLNILANDRDRDGLLSGSTVSIVTAARCGVVQLDAQTGDVTYRPDNGFSGLDKFVYQLRDADGLTSSLATVRVVVMDLQASPWQNPVNALDVNVDEMVTAVDALLVINALNAGQRHALPVPPAPGSLPPPLLDVTGDNMLSPRDALWIINHLATEVRAEGEPKAARIAPSGSGLTDTGPKDLAGDWPVGRNLVSLPPVVAGYAVEAGLSVALAAHEGDLRYDQHLPLPRTRRTLPGVMAWQDDEVFRTWPHELAALEIRL